VAAVLSVVAVLTLVGFSTMIALIGLSWAVLLGPAIVSAALLGAAATVVVRARRRVTTGGLDPEVEQRLLDVAVACHGRVTVTAAARALAMPLAQADAALTAMARSGHVTLDNDPATGVIVYVFPDVEAGLVPVRRLP
jgi:hypothetical protein